MRITNSIIMCNSGGVLAPSLWCPSEDYDPGCFSLLSIQFPECLLKVSAGAVNEDKQSINLWKTHSCSAAPLGAGINIPPLPEHPSPMDAAQRPQGCATFVVLYKTHTWRWFRNSRWSPQKGPGSAACAWAVAHPVVAHSYWHVGSLYYLQRKVSQDCILYY